MSEQAIAIYCFIDDFLKTIGHKTDAHCKVSDAEIMTTALIAAPYFLWQSDYSQNLYERKAWSSDDR